METSKPIRIADLREALKEVATKEDLQGVRGDLQAVKGDLGAVSGDLEAVKGDIQGLAKQETVDALAGTVTGISKSVTDLQEVIKGLAKQETVTALAGTVTAIMETVAELKEDVTTLKEDASTTKGILKDMMEELTATHADVRHTHTTVTMLVRSDTAHDTTITDHTTRIQRLERKTGLAN